MPAGKVCSFPIGSGFAKAKPSGIGLPSSKESLQTRKIVSIIFLVFLLGVAKAERHRAVVYETDLHMSAENTGHRIKSERPKLFEEAHVKRFSEGRIGRRRKARRVPLLVSAARVNWEATRIPPLTVFRLRFILPVGIAKNSIADDFFREGVGILELIRFFLLQTKTIKP